MKPPRPAFILALLLAVVFSMSTSLQPRAEAMRGRDENGDLLQIALGDGRRMFANHFFVKADVYFHRGFYPSFIDQSYSQSPVNVHIAERHEPGEADHDEDEKSENFLGKPQNWIDRFGRNFYPSVHTHRDQPGEAREILPWLRLSAELDPHRVDTYTVAAYWLVSNMGKVDEAEEFLREGLRANPDSYDILFDLGNLYYKNRHDPNRARNLWELALRRWKEQDTAGKKPDPIAYDKLVANLAHLEEEQGNLREALSYLEIEVKTSPAPEAVQKQIDELKQKLSAAPAK